ncbi:MAG: hypothetical protein ABIG96_01825 [Candidatus Micrarchaeota archaeon]
MDLKIVAVLVAAVLVLTIGFTGMVKADSDSNKGKGKSNNDFGKGIPDSDNRGMQAGMQKFDDDGNDDSKNGKGNSGPAPKYNKIDKELDKQYKALNKEQKRLWIRDRLGKEIGRAQGLVTRVERLSLLMKERGFDTAQLDADIAAIGEKLNLANTKTGSGMKEGIQLLREALKDFQNLIKSDLRDLAKRQRERIREHMNYTDGNGTGDGDYWKIVEGTGTLTASLTGQAELEGSGTVVINSRNGDLRIMGGNVTVEGNGTRIYLGDGYIKYKDYATVTVTGNSFGLKVTGNDILFNAEGKGKAELAGRGTYRFGNASDVAYTGKTIIYWNIPIQTVTPSPSPNATASPSPNATVSPTPSINATVSPSPSPNATISPTPTITPSPSINATVSPSPSPTPSVNATASPSPEASPSISPSPSIPANGTNQTG